MHVPSSSAALIFDKVAEGQMKQLDATVFWAADLDVPENTLHFSVVKVPRHGRISNCIGNRLEQVATCPSVVMDFTMSDITNGTIFMTVVDLHLFLTVD